MLPDGKAYGWERGLHPRYLLVMDQTGFPPVDAVVFTSRVALPGVWVNDVDWAPPFRGYGVLRDFDGYEGGLRVGLPTLTLALYYYLFQSTDFDLSRVRFAYNVYIHFWPLTRQEGFDLKEPWMQQGEDHSKPSPLSGHDLTEEVVKERVLYSHGSISWDDWVQFVFAVIMYKLSQLWRVLKALFGL